jgi:O-antigen/teichoic acid export membrane protein
MKAAEVLQNDDVSREIATAAKHSFIYGIGGVLVKGVGFFLLPLYTRYLSPQDYGVFEVLELSVSVLAMFLNMGITAALLRYYAGAATAEEKSKIVGSVFQFTVATSMVVLVAGSLGARRFTDLLLGAAVPSSYLLLSIAGFFLAFISNVPYTALRAREASGRMVTVDTVTSIAQFGLGAILLAAANLAVRGLLVAKLAVNIANIAVLIVWTRRELFGGMDWKLFRRMFAFGAPLVFSNLTMFTLNFSDRFFLQHFHSLEAVGIYAVGYKFGYMLNFLLLQPFNMMWQSRMYLIRKLPDHEAIYARVFVLYSAVLIFAGLGMSLIGPEVMRIAIDARYGAGADVIGIVSLAYVALGLGQYLELGMFLAARTGWIGAVSVAAAAVNLVANYTLIERFGMLGAAWATVLGFGAIAVGSYYCSQHAHSLKLPVGRVVRATAIGIAVYIASRISGVSSVASSLALKSALLLIFPVLLWACDCFSSDELATLRWLRVDAGRRVRPVWSRS